VVVVSSLPSGPVLAAAAMCCVGSSVAVSTTITTAPLFTLQAVRYALAAVVLLVLARVTGRRLPRPRRRDWPWLCGVAATGLVLFNVGIVRGVAHAEPAVIAVAVAAVPLVLAVAGPLAVGSRPSAAVVGGAVVVSAGAVLVSGGGSTDAVGLGWAVVVLVCEVAFTLVAVPVLGRLGPWAVSLHTVWIAAAALAVLGAVVEGPRAVATLDAADLVAAVHLAVVVTALAFVLWYSAVGRIGAARAGLFTGVAPVTAAVGGVLLGGPIPAPSVWAGTAVVALGLALRLDAGTTPVVRAPRRADSRTNSYRLAGPGVPTRGVSPGGGRWRRSGERTFP
jgi:drug/metabolite transporter (DMT)-like permease